MSNNKGVEICCECGESVAFGSGRFVNRIPECNGEEYRRDEMNRPFPKGDYVCLECDEGTYLEAHLDGEEYCPEHGFRESYLNEKDEDGDFIGCFDGCESAAEYDRDAKAYEAQRNGGTE